MVVVVHFIVVVTIVFIIMIVILSSLHPAFLKETGRFSLLKLNPDLTK
jgi:hypothetical protein